MKFAAKMEVPLSKSPQNKLKTLGQRHSQQKKYFCFSRGWMPLIDTAYIKFNTIIQKEHNLLKPTKFLHLILSCKWIILICSCFYCGMQSFEYMNLKQHTQNFHVNRGLQNYLCEAVLLGIHTSLLFLCSNHPGLPATEHCLC